MILTATDFGPPLAPELKLFTYFGTWVLLAGSVLAALVLAVVLGGVVSVEEDDLSDGSAIGQGANCLVD